MYKYNKKPLDYKVPIFQKISQKFFFRKWGTFPFFQLFFQKNFCYGIVPPIQTPKIPLYKGGCQGGGGYHIGGGSQSLFIRGTSSTSVISTKKIHPFRSGLRCKWGDLLSNLVTLSVYCYPFHSI